MDNSDNTSPSLRKHAKRTDGSISNLSHRSAGSRDDLKYASTASFRGSKYGSRGSIDKLKDDRDSTTGRKFGSSASIRSAELDPERRAMDKTTRSMESELEKAETNLWKSNQSFFNTQKSLYGSSAVLNKLSVLQSIKNPITDSIEEEMEGDAIVFPGEKSNLRPKPKLDATNLPKIGNAAGEKPKHHGVTQVGGIAPGPAANENDYMKMVDVTSRLTDPNNYPAAHKAKLEATKRQQESRSIYGSSMNLGGSVASLSKQPSNISGSDPEVYKRLYEDSKHKKEKTSSDDMKFTDTSKYEHVSVGLRQIRRISSITELNDTPSKSREALNTKGLGSNSYGSTQMLNRKGSLSNILDDVEDRKLNKAGKEMDMLLSSTHNILELGANATSTKKVSNEKIASTNELSKPREKAIKVGLNDTENRPRGSVVLPEISKHSSKTNLLSSRNKLEDSANTDLTAINIRRKSVGNILKADDSTPKIYTKRKSVGNILSVTKAEIKERAPAKQKSIERLPKEPAATIEKSSFLKKSTPAIFDDIQNAGYQKGTNEDGKMRKLPLIDSANTIKSGSDSGFSNKASNPKTANDPPLKNSGSLLNLSKSDSQSNLTYIASSAIGPKRKSSQGTLLSKGSQSNLLRSKGSQSNLLKSSGSDPQSNMSKSKGSQGNIFNPKAYVVQDKAPIEKLNTDELLDKLEIAEDVLFDANRQFFSAQKAIYGSQAVMSKYSVLQGIKNEREEGGKDQGSDEQEDGESMLFPSEMKNRLPTIKKKQVMRVNDRNSKPPNQRAFPIFW
ncbi:hypothetical protein HDV01_003676 [Terramyces sp. JEL0728]|nr:hypothetical protein HDV01_003676 [Terramyces sp. JEL0728]